MDTISVKVNYNGEVKINDEHTAVAPLEMVWFPDNDLVIETMYERIVFNESLQKGEFFVITPQVGENNLVEVKDVDIKLMQNNLAKYIIVNDKFAYRLPNSLFDRL